MATRKTDPQPYTLLNDGYEAAVPLDTLELYPGNPNEGDLDAIGESIDTNGYGGALFVQRSTRRVLSGNSQLQRLRAAGATGVPVIWIACDDATADRLVVAYNRTRDRATYDDAALVELLTRIAEEQGSLTGTGFDDDTVAELAATIAASEPAGGRPASADALAGTEDRYSEQHGVIVLCSGEKHQREVYDRLVAEGFNARVVTV